MKAAPRATPSAVPAASPAWDGPLSESALVFIDLEMTGLDPAVDRVIEVCAVRVVGGREVARVESLVRPEDGRFGNERIHGIRAEELADAPTFGQVFASLVPLLDDAVLVAHGAAWDATFLRSEVARLGAARSFDVFLDTLPVCRRVYPRERHALVELAKSLSLAAAPTHRAGSDVATVRCLFDALVDAARPPTVRALFELGRAVRGPSPIVVEVLRAALTSGTPTAVTFRRAGKPAVEAVLVVQRLAEADDPPCVEGYLLPSRGRTKIRLDRVVRAAPKTPDPAA